MKKTFCALALAGTAVAIVPLAQADGTSECEGIPGEFSAYATFVSDYTFRGITQSDEGPAVQAGIDWNHDSGVYAGIWGSNVDFNDGDEATIEIDYFAGYSTEIYDDLTMDIGASWYSYPGAANALDYDYYEIYASFEYDYGLATGGVGGAFTGDNFGGTGDAQYVNIFGSLPLPHDLTLSGHLGRQWVEDNTNFGVPDYFEWQIGMDWEYEQFIFNLSYVDTNLNETYCADGCDGKLVVGVSAGF